MFAGWQTFYQMTGEAAATLTGLVFVIVSLAAGRQGDVNGNGVRLFTTPIVFHLTSVLVISGLALAPASEPVAPIYVMTVWSLGAFAYATRNLVAILRIGEVSHWSGPVALWRGAVRRLCRAGRRPTSASSPIGLNAIYALSISLLALLLIGVRNAWDLATWLAPRRTGLKTGADLMPDAPDLSDRLLVAETRLGRLQLVARTQDAAFLIDEPTDVGGLGSGPNPYDLLAAALGACKAMTMRLYADRKGWPLARVQVSVRHARASLEARDRFECTVEMEGPLDDAQRTRLLEIADHCPVHRTLDRGSDVATRLAATDAAPSSISPSAHMVHMEQASAA